jgi:hypothetical protein
MKKNEGMLIVMAEEEEWPKMMGKLDHMITMDVVNSHVGHNRARGVLGKDGVCSLIPFESSLKMKTALGLGKFCIRIWC